MIRFVLVMVAPAVDGCSSLKHISAYTASANQALDSTNRFNREAYSYAINNSRIFHEYVCRFRIPLEQVDGPTASCEH